MINRNCSLFNAYQLIKAFWPFGIFLKYIHFIATLVYPIEDEQCIMDDIWLHNVKIMEIFSESFPQLALNLWVMKIYGISDPIQLVSATLAYFGGFKIQVDRLCLIRNSEDFGMASWSYVKSFLDFIIPWSTGFICYLIALSEDCMPAWVLHSNLDLGVVLVSRGLTPKSREILNQGFCVNFVEIILQYKAQNDFNFPH